MHNIEYTIQDGGPKDLTIKRSQEIPDSFLEGLRREREASNAPAGNFHRFASIPVVVVEKWKREGFDIMAHNYSASEIMAKLSREDLGAFITTNKVL